MKKIMISVLAFVVFWVFSNNGVMGYELIVKENHITIHAEHVPLQELLKDFSHQAGVQIHIDPAINPFISARFQQRPTENALKFILHPLNHIMKWERSTGRDNGQFRLTEIHIFNRGEKNRTVSLKSDNALDIARNPQDGSFYVNHEVLLRFKHGLNDRYLNQLLKKLDGSLVSVNPAINMYRIKLPPDTSVLQLIEILNKDPLIAIAEPNYAYPIAQPFKYITDDTIPEKTIAHRISGHGQPIAVLDSGLMPGKLPETYMVEALNALEPDMPIFDPLGHGTQMVMVASGYINPMGFEESEDEHASNPVIAIRAFDQNGFMSSDILMRSIDYALDSKAKVVSMSWGSDINSDFVNDVINYGASRGLIFVASAGNEPTGKPVYPAAYENVISIGALAPDGKQWENTNFGDFVDGFIPGFANMPVGYMADPGIYAGTSISTAYAANRIASFLSKNPDAKKAAILDHLFKKRTDPQE